MFDVIKRAVQVKVRDDVMIGGVDYADCAKHHEELCCALGPVYVYVCAHMILADDQ